jgi:hypothetical protein
MVLSGPILDRSGCVLVLLAFWCLEPESNRYAFLKGGGF